MKKAILWNSTYRVPHGHCLRDKPHAQRITRGFRGGYQMLFSASPVNNVDLRPFSWDSRSIKNMKAGLEPIPEPDWRCRFGRESLNN